MPPKGSKKATEPKTPTRSTATKRKASAIADKLRVSPQEEAKGVEAKVPVSKRAKKAKDRNTDILWWGQAEKVPEPYNPPIHPEFSNIPAQWQQLITFGIERALTKSILEAINTALEDQRAGIFGAEGQHCDFEILPRLTRSKNPHPWCSIVRDHGEIRWDIDLGNLP